MSVPDHTRFRVRLTLDMAQSLLEHFHRFEGGGIVTLEINQAGIWFIDPESDRVRFLGQADYTEEQLARLRARCH